MTSAYNKDKNAENTKNCTNRIKSIHFNEFRKVENELISVK